MSQPELRRKTLSSSIRVERVFRVRQLMTAVAVYRTFLRVPEENSEEVQSAPEEFSN